MIHEIDNSSSIRFAARDPGLVIEFACPKNPSNYHAVSAALEADFFFFFATILGGELTAIDALASRAIEIYLQSGWSDKNSFGLKTALGTSLVDLKFEKHLKSRRSEK